MTYNRTTDSATDALRRAIEALLQHHDAHAVLTALRTVTRDLYDEHRTPVQAIVDAVAAAHGLTTKDMLTQCRTVLLSRARHHAAWEIRRRRPEVPLTKIAAWLNRTDHATVIHSLMRWQRIVDAGQYAAERAHVERALSC